MGVPSLGRFLRSPPNATKKPVVGQGQGPSREGHAGPTDRRHPCRPGLRLPTGSALARQLHRLGSGTVRTVSVSDFQGNGHLQPVFVITFPAGHLAFRLFLERLRVVIAT